MGSTHSSPSTSVVVKPNPPPPAPTPIAPSKVLASGETLVDLSTGRTKTGLVFGTGARKFAITHEHTSSGKEVTLRLDGRNWFTTFEPHTKNLQVAFRPQLKHGAWTLKQKIPAGNWALFPSPELQVAFKPVQLGWATDSLMLSYSFLTRSHTVSEAVELLDGRLMLTAAFDSALGQEGTELSALCKPNSGFAKRLGVYYSQLDGPRMSLTTEASATTSVTSTINLRAQTVRTVLQLVQSPGTTVEVTTKVGPKLNKPSITVGIKSAF